MVSPSNHGAGPSISSGPSGGGHGPAAAAINEPLGNHPGDRPSSHSVSADVASSHTSAFERPADFSVPNPWSAPSNRCSLDPTTF